VAFHQRSRQPPLAREGTTAVLRSNANVRSGSRRRSLAGTTPPLKTRRTTTSASGTHRCARPRHWARP
jgi:hypothetical protein